MLLSLVRIAQCGTANTAERVTLFSRDHQRRRREHAAALLLTRARRLQLRVDIPTPSPVPLPSPSRVGAHPHHAGQARLLELEQVAPRLLAVGLG